MKQKEQKFDWVLPIIMLFLIGFVFFTEDGDCIRKGGKMIASIKSSVEECHGIDDCKQYIGRICYIPDRNAVPIEAEICYTDIDCLNKERKWK